jgi:hypothetical protein
MPPFPDHIRYLLENKPDLLAPRVEELRQALRQRDPQQLAVRTGANYLAGSPSSGAFNLPVWGRMLQVSYPDFVVSDPHPRPLTGVAMQAMLMYYFTTADGTPAGADWIAFSDLPDGRFYTQAYQGYTGKLLAQRFGSGLAAFEAAAQATSGQRQALASAAYAFNLLPYVRLLVAYWLGDEDFPASCQVLFSSGVAHYLPTDACAIAGGMLARRILASADLQMD